MQQIITKVIEFLGWLIGKGDTPGIVQEIKTKPFYQMVYVQTRICHRKWNS